jgi:hypothetical protein
LFLSLKDSKVSVFERRDAVGTLENGKNEFLFRIFLEVARRKNLFLPFFPQKPSFYANVVANMFVLVVKVYFYPKKLQNSRIRYMLYIYANCGVLWRGVSG